jgi:hypothetical protein
MGTRAWFQVDREGDRFATLKTLHESGHWFTVRSTYGHRRLVGEKRTRLRHAVGRSKIIGHYTLEVPAKYNRKGRTATMAIRATTVTLDMWEVATGDELQLLLNVVDVREVGPRPRNTPPIHWRLFTNRAIKTRKKCSKSSRDTRNAGKSRSFTVPGSQGPAVSKKRSCAPQMP